MRGLITFVMVVVTSYGYYLEGAVSQDYTLTVSLMQFILALLHILDFIQFAYYSRRLYLYLKSREKEIRLFYFDKRDLILIADL